MKVNFYDYNNNRYVEYEQKKAKPASFESILKRTRGKPSRAQMKKDLGKYIKDEDVLDLVMTLSESELVKSFYTCKKSEHKTKKGKKKKEYLWDFDKEKLDKWIEETTKEIEEEKKKEEEAKKKEEESEEDEDIIDEEDEDEEDEKWFNAIKQKDKEKKEEESDEEVKKEEPEEEPEEEIEDEIEDEIEEEPEEKPKKKIKEPEPEEDEGEEDFRSDVYKPAEYRLVFDLLGKKLNNKTKNLVKEKKLKDDAGSIFKLQKSVNGFEEGTLFWVGNKREIETFAEKMLLSEFDVWDLMAWSDTKDGIDNINRWEDKYNDKNYLDKRYFENGIWDWAYAKAEKASKLRSRDYESRLEELVAENLKDFPGYTDTNFRYNKKTGKTYFVEPTKEKVLSGDKLREASLDMLKRRVATNVVIECQEKTKGNVSSIMRFMFGEDWYAIIHSDEYKEEWSGFDDKFKIELWARYYVEKDNGVSFVFKNFAKPTKGETKHPEDNIHVMNVFVNRTQQEKLYYATLDKKGFKELGLEQMLENMID
jgi:hypothetical protein